MSSLRGGDKMKLDRELSMPLNAAAATDTATVMSSHSTTASRLRNLSRTFSLISSSSSSLSLSSLDIRHVSLVSGRKSLALETAQNASVQHQAPARLHPLLLSILFTVLYTVTRNQKQTVGINGARFTVLARCQFWCC